MNPSHPNRFTMPTGRIDFELIVGEDDLEKFISAIQSEYASTIGIELIDDSEEAKASLLSGVGTSARGVLLICYKYSNSSTIILMPMSSRGDCVLAYTALKVADRNGWLSSQFEEENWMPIDEQFAAALYESRIDDVLNYMLNINNHPSVKGLHTTMVLNDAYISSNLKGKSSIHTAENILSKFVELQWDYNQYPDYSTVLLTNPLGEKFETVIITDQKGKFLRLGKEVIVRSEGCADKAVPMPMFLMYATNINLICRIDAITYISTGMPSTEWPDFCDMLPGRPLEG